MLVPIRLSIGRTGTTTATVLARAIYRESCKSTAAGCNPQEMRKGVQMGVDHVIMDLKKRAKMISTTEEIAQVNSQDPPPLSAHENNAFFGLTQVGEVTSVSCTACIVVCDYCC